MSDVLPTETNRLPDEAVTATRAEKDSRRTKTIIGVVAAVIVILIIGGFVLMIQGRAARPVSCATSSSFSWPWSQ
jgi:hypothetical protein